MGKYLYGIIRGGQRDWGTIGLGGFLVSTIGSGPAVVASDYPGTALTTFPREELVRCLLQHQAVVERVMAQYTVLPVKFGTVLACSEEVAELLHQGHSRLVQALAQVEGKVEMEVAATWNGQQALKEVGGEAEVVQLKATIGGKAATLEERVKLGQVVRACLERRREGYREQMLALLRPLALEAHPNPLLNDDLVMNEAFLIDRGRLGEFDRRVKELDGQFQNRLNFRVIGPLPPYTFSLVEVSRPSPEKVVEARQLLGLGDRASGVEIRLAYRRRAAQVHPDLHPEEEQAPGQFSRLREAMELLLAYCRGRGEGERQFHPLGAEEVKHAWLIDIKHFGERQGVP